MDRFGIAEYLDREEGSAMQGWFVAVQYFAFDAERSQNRVGKMMAAWKVLVLRVQVVEVEVMTVGMFYDCFEAGHC
jgi:hypothetical protein